MVLPQMAKWARLKGLDIISATDFTHPLWFRELKSQLEEISEGVYALKSEKKPLFLLATELSSIYKQGEKLRRIHNLVFAPNLETVEKINNELTKRAFNLSADGRPILGLSSENLLELLLSIDPGIFLIPCHIWTPHFGIYGSASGFDSLSEAFGNLEKYIYGIETGLSSDPEMNWQIKELKNRSILSFSDAHSGPKMGREATVFTTQNSKFKIDYNDIAKAVKRDKDSLFKIGYTIEFYPEEGKYHYSGHRNCRIVRGPEETRQDGNICPVCKRRLTEGVSLRVAQLADNDLTGNVETKISPSGIKWYTDTTKTHPLYVKLVPLLEIVAEALSSTVSSQKAKDVFTNLCETFGSEMEVLLKTPIPEVEKQAGQRIAEGVGKVRKGDIVIAPGYDGEYGKVSIWSQKNGRVKGEKKQTESQMGLF